MKKSLFIRLSLVSLSLFMGCSAFRSSGETYAGHSCRDSLYHYHGYCIDQKITKEEFEAEVSKCEKDMASKVCDKELADLLWCQGRAVPGLYSHGGGVIIGKKGIGGYVGGSSMSEGCDCSSFAGALKECRMRKGIF